LQLCPTQKSACCELSPKYRSSGGRSFPRPAIDPPCIEVHENLAEVLVIEDALEDGFVVIHPPDDRPHEHAVEDEPEVLDGVVLGLGTHLGVGYPRLL